MNSKSEIIFAYVPSWCKTIVHSTEFIEAAQQQGINIKLAKSLNSECIVLLQGNHYNCDDLTLEKYSEHLIVTLTGAGILNPMGWDGIKHKLPLKIEDKKHVHCPMGILDHESCNYTVLEDYSDIYILWDTIINSAKIPTKSVKIPTLTSDSIELLSAAGALPSKFKMIIDGKTFVCCEE